ncbi:MAG: hypothetical protein ABR608_05370 [Pseudonocardiaceae bacterium]
MSERYQPPPRSACDVLNFPVDLGEEHGVRHMLHVNIWLYKGRIVRFSLQQVVIVDSQHCLVARIDTCHGEVHRHVFDRTGQEIAPTQLYATVPPHGQDVVEDWYERAYDLMARDWPEFVRRWRRGR